MVHVCHIRRCANSVHCISKGNNRPTIYLTPPPFLFNSSDWQGPSTNLTIEGSCPQFRNPPTRSVLIKVQMKLLITKYNYIYINHNRSWILRWTYQFIGLQYMYISFHFDHIDIFCFSYRSNGWLVPISNIAPSVVTFLSPESTRSPRDTYSPTWIRPSLSTKGG